MNPDAQKIVQLSLNLKSAAIISHENPEGDALGSSLAWAMALEQKGAKTFIYNPDSVPKNLMFLPQSERIKSSFKSLDFEPEAAFIIDCGQTVRMGEEAQARFLSHPLLINIDHHPTNPRFGKINWVEPDASSAGEQIFRLMEAMGCTVDYDIALNIYVAIVVDTKSFQNANTTFEAMSICCELTKRYGFKPGAIAQKVFFTQSYNRLKLLGDALSKVVLYDNGRIAVMTISSDMLEKTGSDIEDLEGFADELRTIDGVRVGIMLRHEKNGKVKISLRSDGRFDVATYSRTLNGGGHLRAAGATLTGDMEEIKQKLIKDIQRMLD